MGWDPEERRTAIACLRYAVIVDIVEAEVEITALVKKVAEVEHLRNELVQADRHVGHVHEHVHDELPAGHVLLDVEDVDPVLRQERREPRDHALLVVPRDADDGFDGGHGQLHR